MSKPSFTFTLPFPTHFFDFSLHPNLEQSSNLMQH
jgi:hypothetical protein